MPATDMIIIISFKYAILLSYSLVLIIKYLKSHSVLRLSSDSEELESQLYENKKPVLHPERNDARFIFAPAI